MLFAVGLLLLPLGPGARPRRAGHGRQPADLGAASTRARSASIRPRSASRLSRRSWASRARRCRRRLERRDRRGPPSSSSATIVRYAVDTCQASPLRMSSAVTRTPTSIDVRQAAFTLAWTVSELPDVHGLQERHPVHRRGDHAAARVADGRDAGHLVAEAHDHAAVHEARGVRVGDARASGSGPTATLTAAGAPRGASVRRCTDSRARRRATWQGSPVACPPS